MSDRPVTEDNQKAEGLTDPAPPRDEQAHRAAVRGLNEHAERLGLLDALEAQPALIYMARGEAR